MNNVRSFLTLYIDTKLGIVRKSHILIEIFLFLPNSPEWNELFFVSEGNVSGPVKCNVIKCIGVRRPVCPFVTIGASCAA